LTSSPPAFFRAFHDGVQFVFGDEFRHGNAGYRCIAWQRHHRIAVATHQHGLDILGRSLERFGQECAITGSIQDPCHAEDAA
jgi:hypothetical protein